MAEAALNSDAAAAVGDRGLLSGSFLGLTATQFLTAVNDNIFRWLVIGIGKDYEPDNVELILMAGTACFVLPYMVLAAPAGYLADRFSKKGVIVGCKVAEIVIMLLGIGSIWLAGQLDNIWLVFIVVAATGAQSALFSPAKMGSIPEILKPENISAANGVFGLATVVSTVIGIAAGSVLAELAGERGVENLWLPGLIVVGVAVLGTAASLAVQRLPAANLDRKIPWDAVSQTWRDLKTLASNGPMFRVALGMVFFWAVGTIATNNIDQFAAEGDALTELGKIPLLISLVVGVGAGSVLAGLWSHGKVELGIVPFGAFGVALCAMLLFTVQGALFNPGDEITANLIWACVLLVMLGVSAGLFDVPLEAYMQERSPPKQRGAILSAANLIIFTGVLLASVLFWALRHKTGEGSLEDVPEAASLSLNAAAEKRVEESAKEYGATAPRGGPQEVKTFVAERTDGMGEAETKATLARVLWIEVNAAQDEGRTVSAGEYYEAFPEDGILVKHVIDQSQGQPLLSATNVFLIFGLLTVPVFGYILWRLPQATVRMLVWVLSWAVYRIRIRGWENVPHQGGALLASNHVSFLDGFLFLLVSSRPVRLIAFVGNFQNRFIHWLAGKWGVIMIGARPKEIRRALETARQALLDGELVVIFPEGGITRSGQLQAFRPGLLKVLEGTGAPVVPVFLDELWGSIFSFEGGRFFWKWPRKWPYPISIHFGRPVVGVTDIHQVRQAVLDLGAQAVEERMSKITPLPREFLRRCKQRKRKMKIADTIAGELTGGELLARTFVLRRLLRRHVLAKDEQHVGLLLPPSLGGFVANMAVALDRRIGVNLNYTLSSEVLGSCIRQAKIKHVLTSKKFMERLSSLQIDAELVYLEDFKEKPTAFDKLIGGTWAYIKPAWAVERLLGLHKIKIDDVATVIFTSGSTGEPKGVMLTHGNIASQVEAMRQVCHLTADDTLIGILPYFHSFGYTITMWSVAGLEILGVYHVNPLDARQVGKLCEKYGATILLSTPTFLRSYLRRCEPQQLKTLEVVVAGAEKLPKETADAFEEKFGVRPIEGYGCTELSPLVAANIPPGRSKGNFQTDRKEGTVGRCVPGVAAKVTDLDSGKELKAGETGMLWVKGTNVMKGYLGQPKLTDEVIQNGWYKTGDVGLIDDEGFIQITGRESRFSKIGGEMVPHVKVEEALGRLVGGAGDDGPQFAVTAITDTKKGEKLIVLHKPLEQSPEDLRKGLSEAGLPNIFIPARESFRQVEELPVLGTGKLDLKGVKKLAEELYEKEEGGKDEGGKEEG